MPRRTNAHVHTFIYAAIGILISSFSAHRVIDPISVVRLHNDSRICYIANFPLSMAFIIAPVSCVDVSIGIGVCSLTVHGTISPFTLVNVSVDILQHPISVNPTIFPVPCNIMFIYGVCNRCSPSYTLPLAKYAVPLPLILSSTHSPS